MGKVRVGNKQNSFLNGEWCKHMKKFGKRLTAGIRRNVDKQEINNGLKEI